MVETSRRAHSACHILIRSKSHKDFDDKFVVASSGLEILSGKCGVSRVQAQADKALTVPDRVPDHLRFNPEHPLLWKPPQLLHHLAHRSLPEHLLMWAGCEKTS